MMELTMSPRRRSEIQRCRDTPTHKAFLFSPEVAWLVMIAAVLIHASLTPKAAG